MSSTQRFRRISDYLERGFGTHAMSAETMHVRYVGAPREAARLLALARDTLMKASADAEAMRLRARQEASCFLRTARKRARASGLRNGERAAKEQLRQTLLEYDQRFRQQIAAAQTDCLNLVLQISEEVIATEVRSDKRGIVARVQRALTGLIEQRALRLQVSHVDHAEVKALAQGEAPMAINVAQDLAPGEARLETPAGILELSWRDHFSAICNHLRSALLKKLHSEGDPECSRCTPSLMN